MDSTKRLYGIHRIFTTLMVISLILGIIFFVTNNLDFIISAITYGKASLPNIVYWLSKVIGTMLIPLVFLVPSLSRFERIKAVKYTFIGYGILQLLTLTWIFWYLGANGFDGLFSNDAVVAFQSAKENSFISSYVFWDTYSWAGSIFTLLYGILCIYTGLNFDDDKKKVCVLTILVAVLRILLPIISNLFSGNGFLSTFWITNNYADIICFVILAAAVVLASTYDVTWISLIWDQEIPQNEEEEEDEF